MSIYTLTNEQRGYCRNGHPWEGDNIIILGSGKKRCRACLTKTKDRYKFIKEKYGIRFTRVEQAEFDKRKREEQEGPPRLKNLVLQRKIDVLNEDLKRLKIERLKKLEERQKLLDQISD